ncbi:hypothetical protein BU25DRAFT_436649 [Macroventuria anomochaeta]|uniref:Uncharacterized protein n=1 Tax=Macroventuria anomochaeta TaxID=301207 RepID=A0ACB6SG45_9PLEO|nr:uncharacterized protein BU25DRAFT_436649 [Macroventuria anomochaeta]KAF2633004.1 hypothetical protein BU25DRAFT_436649 [Macroventuria anomochaeta]
MSSTQLVATTLECLHGISRRGSEDATILLVLFSFLSLGEEVPRDLLVRGATPRSRWTMQGEMEHIDASTCDLSSDLSSLLSDPSRTENALRTSECSMDQEFACRIHEALSEEQTDFWRRQALIVAYRAIHWKYLEPSVQSIELFVPHLKHAVQAFDGSFECLPESTRVDLALTLIESFRFPTMEWKRFAVIQAKAAARGLNHSYLNSCIAQSQCILDRLAGNIDKAVDGLRHAVQYNTSPNVPRQMHSVAGQIAIQQCLNFIQVENISTAQQTLEDWEPINPPSLMEDTVLLRKQIMLGKSLRYQGRFEESRISLEKAFRIVNKRGVDTFDEDLSDLTCEMADTLRELHETGSAEDYLRIEMTRREHSSLPTRGLSALQLSLAEVMFVQGRFEEAVEICLEISHIQSNFNEAMCFWNIALQTIHKLPRTNGRTTRSIVSSISRCLYQLGHLEIMQSSLKQVQTLDELAKPDSVQHWIAGTQDWLGWLDRSDTDERSRL